MCPPVRLRYAAEGVTGAGATPPAALAAPGKGGGRRLSRALVLGPLRRVAAFRLARRPAPATLPAGAHPARPAGQPGRDAAHHPRDAPAQGGPAGLRADRDGRGVGRGRRRTLPGRRSGGGLPLSPGSDARPAAPAPPGRGRVWDGWSGPSPPGACWSTRRPGLSQGYLPARSSCHANYFCVPALRRRWRRSPPPGIRHAGRRALPLPVRCPCPRPVGASARARPAPGVTALGLALGREALALAGADVPAGFDGKAQYEPAPPERATAARLWRSNRLDEARAVVAIHPAPGAPAKRWPAQRFAIVADHFAGRYGARIVVTGGPGDVDEARAVAAACPTTRPWCSPGRPPSASWRPCSNAAGWCWARTTAPCTWPPPAACPRCASSVRSTRPPGGAGRGCRAVRSPPTVSVAAGIACAPCHRLDLPPWTAVAGGGPGAPAGDAYPCMRDVTAETVIAAVERVWALTEGTPAAPAARMPAQIPADEAPAAPPLPRHARGRPSRFRPRRAGAAGPRPAPPARPAGAHTGTALRVARGRHGPALAHPAAPPRALPRGPNPQSLATLQRPLLADLPFVDAVLTWTAGDVTEPRVGLRPAAWRAAWHTVGALRRGDYDLALACYGQIGSAVSPASPAHRAASASPARPSPSP